MSRIPEIIEPAPKRVAHFLVYPENAERFNRSQAADEEIKIASWLRGKAPRTRRYYTRELRNFFALFPGLLVKEITSSHISIYLAKKEKEGGSPASLKQGKDALSSMLSYMARDGHIPRNPALALNPIKIPDRTAFRVLSEDQVERLLGAEGLSLRNRLILEFLFVTGFRVEELCTLTWGCFLPRGEVVQVTIKGKGSKVRSIVVERPLFDRLLELAGDRIPDGKDAVFRSNQTPYGRLSTAQVWRIVKRAARVAKLPAHTTTHMLRHTHATNALNNGCPIHVLQKSLGHESLKTTSKYLDVFPNESSAIFIKRKGKG